MRTVIIRDDDTNALTPAACLEQLYRPFLARGLPVNLATIPEVRTDVCTPGGGREGFLLHGDALAAGRKSVPLADNTELVGYLRANPGYHVVQHGCHHDAFEFDRTDRFEIVRRLELGAQRLREAGLPKAHAFVAPHDKISRVAYEELARRFHVVSTGWFEWRRLPPLWLPRYAAKKLLGQPHWRVGSTQLLSHPGCLLSYQRPYETMLASIRATIARQEVTVLVTHWWEYFRDGRPDEAFIAVLHDTAAYLASQPNIRVTSFEAFARRRAQRGRPVPVAPLPAAAP